MDAHMNGILEEIKSRIAHDRALGEEHGDGSAGVGGAHNVSDVTDAFDKYVEDMVDALMVTYDISEDDALAYVSSAVDELIDAGALTPIPDISDIDGLSLWLGAAMSNGLGGYARKMAHDDLGQE